MESANIFQVADPFLDKSFGCDICSEMFGIEKEFLEHCFSHTVASLHLMTYLRWPLCFSSQSFGLSLLKLETLQCDFA